MLIKAFLLSIFCKSLAGCNNKISCYNHSNHGHKNGPMRLIIDIFFRHIVRTWFSVFSGHDIPRFVMYDRNTNEKIVDHLMMIKCHLISTINQQDKRSKMPQLKRKMIDLLLIAINDHWYSSNHLFLKVLSK